MLLQGFSSLDPPVLVRDLAGRMTFLGSNCYRIFSKYTETLKKVSMNTQNDAIGKCMFISNVAMAIFSGYFWGSIVKFPGGIDHPIFPKKHALFSKKMLVHLVHFARTGENGETSQSVNETATYSSTRYYNVLACWYIRITLLRQVLTWKTTSSIPCHVGATYC